MRLARKPLHAVTPIWQYLPQSDRAPRRFEFSQSLSMPVFIPGAPTEACVRCRLHSGFLGFEQDFLCELVLTHLSIGDLNGSVGLAIPEHIRLPKRVSWRARKFHTCTSLATSSSRH
jgi:hypothetical protein